MSKVSNSPVVAEGCHFHGCESGHHDSGCPETDFNPPMRVAWRRCQAQVLVYGRIEQPASLEDRQRFFVNEHGHGWWDPVCKGLVQAG